MHDEALIRIENLKKHYSSAVGNRRVVRAVDGVTFEIMSGETFGLIGESACGKTTLGRLILGLERPSSGSIDYDGQRVKVSRFGFRNNTAGGMQVVHQNSAMALDPYRTVGESLAEPMHGRRMNRKDLRAFLEHLLSKVGLDASEWNKYPHELSGGQQQRLCIARALTVNPAFLFCDEPLTALDVSIQAQIVNLLIALREEYNLTCLFVTHDLTMARYISHRTGVMYMGRLVEICDTETLYRDPVHPYTVEMLSCVPDWRKPVLAKDEILFDSAWQDYDGASGCAYAGQCRWATKRCLGERPELSLVGPEHWCACHRRL